jgi:hypothetical protein
VDHRAPGAAVPVDERMDRLELGVSDCRLHDRRQVLGVAERAEIVHQACDQLGGAGSRPGDVVLSVSRRATIRYVPAAPLSIRLPEPTLGRLADRADRSQMPARTLAQRYVEEGLRMDEHPLICFADGPTGRRARLIGGPDVWELIAVAQDHDGDLAETAAYLELPLGLAQAAAAYYAAHKDEIDARIERNRRAAEEAHSAFLAAREALGR